MEGEEEKAPKRRRLSGKMASSEGVEERILSTESTIVGLRL